MALKSVDDQILNFLLVGDNMLIDLESANYIDGIFYLLCYYYTFGEIYPPKWSEFLTIFQLYCLKDDSCVKKGVAFRKFEEELRTVMD